MRVFAVFSLGSEERSRSSQCAVSSLPEVDTKGKTPGEPAFDGSVRKVAVTRTERGAREVTPLYHRTRHRINIAA